MALFKPPTTEKTRTFYRELQEGKRNPLFWGNQRFDSEKRWSSHSLKNHFQRIVDGLLQEGDRVLDVGCGSGLFLPFIYRNTTRIHAVDTSPALLEEARLVVETCKLEGTVVLEADVEKLAFEDASFDSIIAVDVLHHFHNLDLCLMEMRRVLRPGGKLIIFEPNKLNPLLALGCLIDRNEWGLLALGRRGLYKHRLSPFFDIQSVQFNGLIIGPDGRMVTRIADFVTRKPWSRIFGWLAPKILILAEKPHS